MARFPRLTLGQNLARRLYCLAWWLATPAVLLSLLWRGLRQRGYLQAVGERFGYCPRAAGERLRIWVHAVSVGETRAAEPLIRAMAAHWPDADILLTHMTPTGRSTGAAALADLIEAGRLRQAWLPWDYPGATRRLFSRARPAVGILMETELWPNLVAAARSASVPLVLASARLSERSLRKGLRWHALIGPALLALDQVWAQTNSDALRLERLGRPGVPALGNLKFDISPPSGMLALGAMWRKCLLSPESSSGIVVAASTREGEEAVLLQAWRRIHGSTSDRRPPRLVIVPRHPQRFDAVVDLAREQGWRVCRRSAFTDGRPGADALDADLIVGDSMGEMFAWYALADVAIIGGSFAPLGGQNLIEACAAGCPVLLGPHTFNFEEVSEDAIAAGAAIRVADADAAVHQAIGLLDDLRRRQAMAAAASSFSAQHRGATGRTLERVVALIATANTAESAVT